MAPRHSSSAVPDLNELNPLHAAELEGIKHLLRGLGLFRLGCCWLWQRSVQTNGYGYINVHGRQTMAHRRSYELFKGPIPPGMLVCHVCDTPPCVNPDHLFLGTNADNALDKVLKQRARREAFL